MALRPACRSCRRDEARIRIAAIRARRSTVTATLLTPRLSLLLAHDSSRKAANVQKATRQQCRRYYSINWTRRRIRVERGGVRSAEKAQWLEPDIPHHHPPPPFFCSCARHTSLDLYIAVADSVCSTVILRRRARSFATGTGTSSGRSGRRACFTRCTRWASIRQHRSRTSQLCDGEVGCDAPGLLPSDRLPPLGPLWTAKARIERRGNVQQTRPSP